jgi:hypothetical protein
VQAYPVGKLLLRPASVVAELPHACVGQWSGSHTLYETSVQKVGTWDGSGRPEKTTSMRQMLISYVREEERPDDGFR